MGLFSESEIAPYEVLQKWDDLNVELRSYGALKWVSTSQVADNMDSMSSGGFFKLFNYIRGENIDAIKMPMTKPVLIESKPNPESALNRIFTMGFYIPAAFSDAPPAPTASDVFINQRGEMKVYCCNYSGFSNDAKFADNARQLAANLDKLGLKYKSEPLFFAGYDSPFHLFNRRNEMGLSSEPEITPYEVLQKWDDLKIELRLYRPLKWVCMTQVADNMDSMSSGGFFKLFNYIRGGNVGGRKMSMTKPVLIESKPNPESALNRIFTMGFYIPSAFSHSPPAPKASDVFLHQREEMKIYCLTYSGFSNDKKFADHARQLAANLDKLGLKYKSEPLYSAGYDSPLHLVNRRNEVWFRHSDT